MCLKNLEIIVQRIICHYLSASGLSWNAMLKITKLNLNLLQIVTCIYSLRKVQANNKYLKSYDPKQESKNIIYLDPNNLYGYAMTKFFLTSGLKCIDPKDFDSNKYTSNSSKGCVLRIDLEYPKEL